MNRGEDGRLYTAVGLMSGTSLDGVDCALIRTDGDVVDDIGPAVALSYSGQQQAILKDALALAAEWKAAPERLIPPGCAAAAAVLHDTHVAAVRAVMQSWSGPLDIIGYHGQTLVHRPNAGWTFQLADPSRMATELGVRVVTDFRSADMAMGGEGAPLAPLYHKALLQREPQASSDAVLNLGGVGNITLKQGEDLLAFDTGPANALLDDFVRANSNHNYDQGGSLAARGCVNQPRVQAFLEDPYFAATPPKSLDRDHWSASLASGLGPGDGAATLTAMTAGAVARALNHVQEKPIRIWVTGGGRHNPTMMALIADYTGCIVKSVDELGWRGDMLEAEAFAFLAVRSLLGLTLSEPGTTGCRASSRGGVHYLP